MRSISTHQHGFTLVEILVSVAIFALVVTAAIGAILSMVDASQKARSMSAAMTNLNIALESMSRQIRVGSHYSCEGSGSPCTTVVYKPADSTNELAKYSLLNGKIQFCQGNPCTWIAVTAPEAHIDELAFYVNNTTQQPAVFMKIKGRVEERQNTATTFYIQTLMTQRILGTR